jgi:hypothetical protein
MNLSELRARFRPFDIWPRFHWVGTEESSSESRMAGMHRQSGNDLMSYFGQTVNPAQARMHVDFPDPYDARGPCTLPTTTETHRARSYFKNPPGYAHLWVSGEVYEPPRNSQKAMRAVA